MAAYKYWQSGEKEKWHPIEDGTDVEQRALALGAKKLTILSVSEVIDNEETEREDLAYAGPLYFDLDYKEGLEVVIESAKELLAKLGEYQVPDYAIEIFLSGSKGVHVLVPAKVFSSGRAKKQLPQIYRRMAYHLHVRGMDFQVYSGGRGNSFRIANVQRYDGNYRVPVAAHELRDLTPEKYREMVSQPRQLARPALDFGNVPPAASLKAMMERCEKELAKKIPVSEVPAADLSKIRDPIPACIDALADYKVKPDKNFNEVALQLGVFIARAQPSQATSSTLLSRLALKGHSTQYGNEKSRYMHAVGAQRYAETQTRYKFSCRAMRDMLTFRPCDGCPIETTATVGDDLSLGLGIREDAGGTWIAGEDGDRQMMSFSMQATDLFFEWNQAGTIKRRVGALFDVSVAGEERYRSLMVPESAWASKGAFIGSMQGLQGVAFLGSNDVDVQKLKLHAFRNEKDMGEIINVHTAGVLFENDPNAPGGVYRVYVEPGWSFSQLRVVGTHSLASRIPAPPAVSKVSLPRPGDEKVKEAIGNLLEVNAPHIVGQMLGWFMACHLKAHIHRLYQQFPFLGVWGNAEAGKTQTTGLFSCLNGTDFLVADSPMNASKASEFALLTYVSSSTTVPRILEEFNKSAMDMRRYSMVAEVLKSSYNQLAFTRGTLNRSKTDGPGRVSGASTVEIPITSPLITISEQGATMPALQHRSIQVMLSKATRTGRDQKFQHARDGRHQLHQVARAAVVLSMITDLKHVHQIIENQAEAMPAGLVDRSRFNYQVILAGIEFARELFGAEQLNLGLDDKIDELRRAVISSLSQTTTELVQSKERSEVDAMMETIMLMIMRAMVSQVTSTTDLSPNIHFRVEKEKGSLYLFLPVVHAVYKQYCRQMNDNVVIGEMRILEQLLRQEPYYITDKAIVPGAFQNRPVWQLDLAKMRKKGLSVEMIS